MTTDAPSSLEPECLLAHLRVLCRDIGPRPPTSPQERRAAEYVRATLHELGVERIEEQSFRSQDSLGWNVLPIGAAGTLAGPLAALGGRWGKMAGGVLLLAAALALYEFARARPPVFQRLIARGTSQNVIATIPAMGSARRRLFLVGHLDSQKQRFLSPLPRPELTKPMLTFSIVSGALAGIALLVAGLRNRRGLPGWLGLLTAAYGQQVLLALADECQPHVAGANDNASAVSILLGMGEALAAHPLQHTEVTLLFTGCEEVPCVGMESYLRHYQPPRADTYWIDLEMVGTGGLCYVTRHGMSHLTEYAPAPEMVALAEATARAHPELGVTGKRMLIMEEVANLRHHGYRAICLAGYDARGYLPNWHRLSDNLEHIEPDTLSRAARFTWQMMQRLDALPD